MHKLPKITPYLLVFILSFGLFGQVLAASISPDFGRHYTDVTFDCESTDNTVVFFRPDKSFGGFGDCSSGAVGAGGLENIGNPPTDVAGVWELVEMAWPLASDEVKFHVIHASTIYADFIIDPSIVGSVEYTVVDDAELVAAIEAAQSRYDSGLEEEDPSIIYPPSIMTALQEAIDIATALKDDHTLTAADLHNAAEELLAAIVVFEAGIILPVAEEVAEEEEELPEPTPPPIPPVVPPPAPSPSGGASGFPAPTPTPAGQVLGTTTSVAELADGTLILDTLDGRTVYLIGNNGIKRGFVSEEVFRGLGYSFDQALPYDASSFATGEPIDSAFIAHPDGSLVLAGDGIIWWINYGKRHAVPSMEVFESYGWNRNQVLSASTKDFTLEEGLELTLI